MQLSFFAGYGLVVMWLTSGCQLGVTWVSLGCHLVTKHSICYTVTKKIVMGNMENLGCNAPEQDPRLKVEVIMVVNVS